MFPFGGPVTFKTPLPAVKDRPTRRWSILKAWVTDTILHDHHGRNVRRIGGLHLEGGAVANYSRCNGSYRRASRQSAVGVVQVRRRINLDVLFVGTARRVTSCDPYRGVRQQ